MKSSGAISFISLIGGQAPEPPLPISKSGQLQNQNLRQNCWSHTKLKSWKIGKFTNPKVDKSKADKSKADKSKS